MNCVDVGAHVGDILDLMLSASPDGRHFAFEPLPHLYEKLVRKYEDMPIQFFNCALSDKNARSNFHYVVSNPAYSGIKRRTYDRKNEQVQEIEVELRTMDDCIPKENAIGFVKIDVEGAELYTLRGATRILKRDRPLILFEHGRGGADSYSYNANEMWAFLDSYDYSVLTLSSYLNQQESLTLEDMCLHFEKGDEFYFVAKPRN